MAVVVFFEYLSWQYGAGIQEYIMAWQNIHWFLYRMFSVHVLLRTFFAPFRRTSESYGKSWDPSHVAQIFLENMVTRFVGMLVRSVLLFIGAVMQIIVFLLGSLLFVVFLTGPVALPASILAGIVIIFT